MFIKRSVSKKVVAGALAICLAILPAGAAFAGNAPDLAGNWAKDQISRWMDQGLISGYPDGEFKPDNPVTRAELTVLINRAFGFTETKKANFNDISSSKWYYSSILQANAAGYIQGYEDGTFKPDQKINRQELAVIISKLLKLTAPAAAPEFKDITKSAAWSKGAIGAVSEQGIMKGSGDGNFRPLAYTTRAETVVILDRALSVLNADSDEYVIIYETPGIYGPLSGMSEVDSDVVVSVPGITLRNMNITGNLLLGEGIAEGDVRLQNVTVRGNTAIEGGGVNSIHLADSTLGSVRVDKEDGSVRVVAEGKTQIHNLEIQSAAAVESLTGAEISTLTLSPEIPADARILLNGSFKAVNILASRLNIELSGGTIETFNVDKTAGSNKLSNSSNIKSMTMNAGIQISGKGNIGNAVVNASGITMENAPGKLTIGTDVPADVKVNIAGSDLTVAASSAAPTAAVLVGGGGGGAGGGDGGGSTVETPAPAVTPTPIATPAPTATPTPIATPAPTATPTPIATPASTATPTPIATPIPIPTATVAPTAVNSPSPSPSSWPVVTPIVTPGSTVAPTPPIVNHGVVKGFIERADGKAVDTGILYLERDSDYMMYSTPLTQGEFSIDLPDGPYKIYSLRSTTTQESISLYYTFYVMNGKADREVHILIPEQQAGTIQYSDGTAFENGEIIVQRLDSGPLGWYSAEIQAGRFNFNLPDGHYNVEMLIYGETNNQLRINYLFEVIDGKSNLDIKLPPKIEGNISFVDGSPIDDGWLEIREMNAQNYGIYRVPVVAGKFDLYLPDGDYNIQLLNIKNSESIALRTQITIVNGEPAAGPIDIKVPLAISGKIYNEDGTPHANGVLMITEAGTDSPLSYAATVTNGNFDFYLPDGEYDVLFYWDAEHQKRIDINRKFKVEEGLLVDPLDIILAKE
ncbi:S-layer domain-containing protein [Paenibacillus sp. FSL R7-277]|uniref:S-layer homology domain-containing protein n=1 Tax=Paenibacillus sp. FSL R7-277 TaxID=1227352 RepID=UPI0003E1DA8D|nr:S-layer homology domain-containing protein [Paenibacillus sp. FSL R7-277]ETT79632.1 S-layer domain-containing protein [Paenibacillus sp. FSL R7-277]